MKRHLNGVLRLAVVLSFLIPQVCCTLNLAAKSSPMNVSALYCTDRFGVLPYQLYSQRSCVMCFQYLFHSRNLYVPTPPMFESLSLRMGMMDPSTDKTNNDSSSLPSMAPLPAQIIPEAGNLSSVAPLCNILTRDECARWMACCKDAQQCCISHNTGSYGSYRDVHSNNPVKSPVPSQIPATPDGYCPRTWDGYSCWGDTPPGTVGRVHCPFFLEHSITTKFAFKTCNLNGTWFTKQSHQWTDYTECMNINSHLTVVYISLACSAVSLIFLIPSTYIFLVYRELRKQQRVKLHIHFFIALALAAIFSILWYALVHYDLLMNTEKTQTVVHRNPVWCRLVSFGKIYFSSCTFSWMFCEGVYLHRLITKAFSPPKRLALLYIIGWSVPALPILIYAIIRGVLANDSCWAKSYGYYEWIIYTPNLVCLIVNMIFLCNILRILLFQMHAHPHEPNNFRRGLKAAFMLVPLFGLQMLLTIYRPSDDMSGAHAYECITHIINNSQGICVSLIFCVFNGEVAQQVRKTCSCCPCEAKGKRRGRMSSAQMTQISTCGDDTKFSTMTPSRSTSGAGFNNHVNQGPHVQLIQPPDVLTPDPPAVEMNEYQQSNGTPTNGKAHGLDQSGPMDAKRSDEYLPLKPETNHSLH